MGSCAMSWEFAFQLMRTFGPALRPWTSISKDRALLTAGAQPLCLGADVFGRSTTLARDPAVLGVFAQPQPCRCLLVRALQEVGEHYVSVGQVVLACRVQPLQRSANRRNPAHASPV